MVPPNNFQTSYPIDTKFRLYIVPILPELSNGIYPITSPTSQLILQHFPCITYVTPHSPTLPLLHLCHSSFSSPFSLFLRHKQSSFSDLSVTSPASQLILQPFRRFTYVAAHSPTLPLLQIRHSSFSNLSFASPTSQDLHLIHLASR